MLFMASRARIRGKLKIRMAWESMAPLRAEIPCDLLFASNSHPSDPTQDIITEAKYLTFGCTSAIASSEAVCEIIEGGGYTPLTALKIQNSDIVEYLDGLPEQKIHCSVMGAEALEAAVYNWAQRRGVDLKKLGVDMHDQETEEGRMVCKCFSITEPYLKRKIRELNLADHSADYQCH